MNTLCKDLRDRIGRDLPHLSAGEMEALAGIVERLVEACQPERIYHPLDGLGAIGDRLRGGLGLGRYSRTPGSHQASAR